MEKTEPIAAKDMDKCATIYRKDPSSFVYVCYHCGATFSDIDCTLQHVETHFQLVQTPNGFTYSSYESKDSNNSTDTHLDTYSIRHITDTTDPEIDIKTEIMESEDDDCSEYSLEGNILDIADLDFDIKMEALDAEEQNSEHCSTPTELIESAKIAGREILPATSKERYDKIYNVFKKWQASKKTAKISHTVLMVFFHELAKKHKPTTLCAYYSMLKATIKINENIDISSYQQVSAFLKAKASGYKPVEARTFSEVDIRKFIDEAPDELWLDVKVVCIFGVTGACRAHELPRITLQDIEKHGDLLLVRIPNSDATKVDRSFTITGKYRTIVQRYAALRTPDMTDDRFFVNYQRGLSFHKTSATIISKAIFNMDLPKKSDDAAAVEYAGDSIQHKKQIEDPVAMDTTVDPVATDCTSTKSSSSRISENVIKVEDSIDTVDEEDSSDSELPIELEETAKCASLEGLPVTSKLKYMKLYNQFEKWRNEKQIQSIFEEVIVAYLKELSKKIKPTSLWTYYSMLKATLRAKKNVDISNFPKVITFLTSQSSGYKPVTASVFSESDIQKFIDEAPDELWLDVKVVCIFGVTGACRARELPRIKVKDIENNVDSLLVRISKSNLSKVDRSFKITGKFLTIVRKYAALRTSNIKSDRFFVNYQSGKCTRQVIGKHKFQRMPRRIASFLQLPDPEGFTGLSFRKTSATIAAKNAAVMDIFKQPDAWESNSVADEPDVNSIPKEEKADDLLPSTMIAPTKAPMNTPVNAPSSKTFTFSVSENVMKVINISSYENDEKNIQEIFGK